VSRALVICALAALCVVVADTWLEYRARTAAIASWDFLEGAQRAGFSGPFWLTPDPWGLK